MKIKRITIVIYFACLMFGIYLYYFSTFKYAMDIILASIIPMAILLPDMIIYKKSHQRSIFNTLIELKIQINIMIASIDFFERTEKNNIPKDPFMNDISRIDFLISQIISFENIYLYYHKEFNVLTSQLNGEKSVIDLANSTIKCTISKYYLDKATNSIKNENNYVDEIDRQFKVLERLCNELLLVIDGYSDKVFNRKEHNQWILQNSITKNSMNQEDIKSRI